MKKKLFIIIAMLIILTACANDGGGKKPDDNKPTAAEALKDSSKKPEEKKTDNKKKVMPAEKDKTKEKTAENKDVLIFDKSKTLVATTVDDKVILLSNYFNEYREVIGLPADELNFYNTSMVTVDEDNKRIFMTYGKLSDGYSEFNCDLAYGDLNTDGAIKMQKLLNSVDLNYIVYDDYVFFSSRKGGLIQYDIENKEFNTIEKRACFQKSLKGDTIYYTVDPSSGDNSALYSYDLKTGEKTQINSDEEFVTAFFDEWTDEDTVAYSIEPDTTIIKNLKSDKELIRIPTNYLLTYSKEYGSYYAKIREMPEKGDILSTLIHDCTMGEIKEVKEPGLDDYDTEEEYDVAYEEYLNYENLKYGKQRFEEGLEDELANTPYFVVDLYYMSPKGAEKLVERNVELARIADLKKGIIGINRGSEKQLKESDVYSIDSIAYGVIDDEVPVETLTIIKDGKEIGEMNVGGFCQSGHYDKYNDLYYILCSHYYDENLGEVNPYGIKVDIFDASFNKLTTDDMTVKDVNVRYNGEVIVTEFKVLDEISKVYKVVDNSLEKLFEIDSALYYDSYTEVGELLRFHSYHEDIDEIVEYDMATEKLSRYKGTMLRDIDEHKYYKIEGYRAEVGANDMPIMDLLIRDNVDFYEFEALQTFYIDNNVDIFNYGYPEPCQYFNAPLN